jgi:hypothetical protein
MIWTVLAFLISFETMFHPSTALTEKKFLRRSSRTVCCQIQKIRSTPRSPDGGIHLLKPCAALYLVDAVHDLEGLRHVDLVASFFQ